MTPPRTRLAATNACRILCALLLFTCHAYDRSLAAYTPTDLTQEVRALWVVRHELKTRASIDGVIAVMVRRGLNVAIVQVRGRGDAYYNSQIVERAHGLAPGLDPLLYFIRKAHEHGIAVHAWVNVFFVADEETATWASARHIINTHPEWFIKDAAGRSLLSYSPEEWKAAQVEGAFLDPALPAVREYNKRIIREILDGYAVDGIHLDFIRYPWSIAGETNDFGRAQADAQGTTREAAVTAMVADVHEMARTHPRNPLTTVAVWPNREKSEQQIFQHWPEWLEQGIVDYAFLMAYYHSSDIHDDRMRQFFDPAINERMIIGIGVYNHPPPETVRHQIVSARAMGTAGVCFFDAQWFLEQPTDHRQTLHSVLEELMYTPVPAGMHAR